MPPVDFTAMDEQLFDAFGDEVVTYTPPVGNPVAVAAAVWAEDPADDREGESGQATVRRARCWIRTSDVASPVRLATVTVNGELWTIESARAVGPCHELQCVRSAAAEVAPSYRKR